MNTMLLHDFAYVPVSAGQVCDRILADDHAWLSPLAADALGEGEALRLRVGPLGGLPMLSKTVSLEVGAPLRRGEVTVVPLTWKATAAPGLFPVLSADLEIAPLDPELTQLTLQGRYEPPLGAIGRRIDRLLMHRVAEASVRAFLSRLVSALVVPDPGGTHVAIGHGAMPSSLDA
jgi:hypothetical protein